MHRALFLAMALLAPTAPAFAIGGLHCEGENGSVSFLVSSGLAHGRGHTLLGFGGDVTTGFATISPELRHFGFAYDDIVQWWHDDQQMNFQLYAQRTAPPHGDVEVTIETRLVEDGIYDGHFRLLSSESPQDGRPDILIETEGKAYCISD